VTIEQLVPCDQASFAADTFTKYSLPLPALAQGYHQFELTVGQHQASCHLIFAPKTCYNPEQAAPQKVWGYAAQLYSLRSDNNWGMGDFGDLAQLVKKSASQQASVIGLNPLHPLYQNNPAHCSPYSPTSRCFLNTLYIDVTKVANYDTCPAAQQKVNSSDFQAKIAFARQTELVDYPAVADVKYPILELLYQDYLEHKEGKYRQLQDDFQQFKQAHGDDLLKANTFEALYEYFRAKDNNAYGWPSWPAEYQQTDSAAVLAFQQGHSARIDYFAFLQWLAHQQLSQVKQLSKQQGMPIGLYLDLAVGCDGSGVDVWSDPELYVSGAAVGAPPDALNTLGQDWGLTPLNPVALQQQGYQPLVKALRSSMQYAGALRIDHILGLMRQYWVAPGMKADQGVYISFPLDDILRIIALESRRAECVVIGEDLGTVPEGFSDIMHSAGLLSYKVLFFERWPSGLLKRPEHYPALSMVTVSTHDLPTLAGWWTGRDLQWRQQLELYPDQAMGQADRDGRIDDRQNLLAALNDLSVIDMDKAPAKAPAKMNRELTLAVQKFLAQAPSHIQLIPLEDSLEIVEQVNIPGTIDQHPNWRQKLPLSLEQFPQAEALQDLAQVMQNARPRQNTLSGED
jgi:4-alpha-glucanotransferase